MSGRIKAHKIVGLLLLYASGLLFLMSTDPAQLPLVLIVVPFLWLFATLFATLWLVLGLLPAFQPHKRRLITAGSGSALPVLLLVFRSMHQLTIRDILLSVVLIAVAAFYVSRADFIQ